MLLLQNLLPGLTPPAEAPEAAEKLAKKASDLSALRSMSLDDFLSKLAQDLTHFAINLGIAIVVFYVGRFIIRKIYALVSSIFLRRRVDASLSTFILSLLNIVLYFILIVTVIGILGIETTSFLALFASAGVAVGMALSGTLQNFAGGVLILLLKPYKIGDYIEAQGYAGTVREIQIFSTILLTADNKSISIPNGGLSTGSVNNWSREEYRRVAWTVSISYGDKVEPIRKAIFDMFAKDPRIQPLDNSDDKAAGLAAPPQPDQEKLKITSEEECKENPADCPKHHWWSFFKHHKQKVAEAVNRWEDSREAELEALMPKPDRAPKVFVNELAASSVDLTVRAWVKTSDYWGVFFDYNERFYNELPQYGANFPFPQLDVHVSHPAPAAT